MNDWQLLEQYATTNSEEAFRTLVERYAGMVYHAALRQAGNPHAAEEVAQIVFIALAEKAGSIPRQATLYGWLFRATRFAVLNQARKNANRERREKEAIVMQPTIEPNDADSVWESITPLLNDALDNLSAADREAVMVRYFGNKSHKDVAETLGVSEETARKRISRAIERLRMIFAKRGTIVSSLALAAAFAAHGVKAAPTEVASSWAKVAMAKAAAGTAATSGGGILALLTSAKVPVAIAAMAGLLALGGFAILISHGSPVATPATNLAAASGTNAHLPIPVVRSKSAATALAASALDKVKAALHDPSPTTIYPNSVMQDAIAGLGDEKRAALPILEAALKDTNDEVCLRAIDGLGIIGPEATEAAPFLLGVLREGGMGQFAQANYTIPARGTRPPSPFPIYANNMILYSLGKIHSAPEILPQFAQLMKESRIVCDIVYKADHQFPGNGQRPLQSGGWLWAMAGENSQTLHAAFVPLLQDSNRAVRFVAALALASALGDQADDGVFTVAAEMLKSGDALAPADAMSLLERATYNLSSDVPVEKPVLTAARLGTHLNEIVTALSYVANHAKREKLRLQASKMLDVLNPGFRKENPELATALEQQDKMQAFVLKVENGEVAMPEIVEGMKRYPAAAAAIASYFARSGSNGVELLPAFAEALSVLAPSSETNGGDRSVNVNLRQRLADAMQRITPDRPKPLFTALDTVALTQIMNDPVILADPDRSQKVSDARTLAEWPTVGSVGPFNVPPDEIRRLLGAVKDADIQTYDALVAKVNKIDPHFFDAPVAGEK